MHGFTVIFLNSLTSSPNLPGTRSQPQRQALWVQQNARDSSFSGTLCLQERAGGTFAYNYLLKICFQGQSGMPFCTMALSALLEKQNKTKLKNTRWYSIALKCHQCHRGQCHMITSEGLKSTVTQQQIRNLASLW